MGEAGEICSYSRHTLAGLGNAYEIAGEVTRNFFFTRQAAKAFMAAARAAIAHGHIPYTNAIATLLVQLHDKYTLETFVSFGLSHPCSLDSFHYYNPVVDYAYALDSFKSVEAEHFYSETIDFPGVNLTPAVTSYAQCLVAKNRATDAFAILNTKLTAPERLRTIEPVCLRLEAAQAARMNTSSALAEVATLERILSHAPGVSVQAVSACGAAQRTPLFAHTNASDDCRNAGLPPSDHCTGLSSVA